MTKQYSINEIAQAIFIVNRHAKTAPQPQHLYAIKKAALQKLLKEKKAIKVGLHFSKNPKYSNQHSTLLIQVDTYYFHMPPQKKDFQQLEHLGDLDESYRNPPVRMGLSKAKEIIYSYTNWKKIDTMQKKYTPSYYIPSSLGQRNWSRKK